MNRLLNYKKGLNLLILVLILVWGSLLQARPPSLTPHDAYTKIEEILKSHISYRHLSSTEILKRTFNNYLLELDPSKTYFLDYELLKWTNPSEELIEKTLFDYGQEIFDQFEELHNSIAQAIERRNRLEEQISSSELPKGVQSSEFKDLVWVDSEEG